MPLGCLTPGRNDFVYLLVWLTTVGGSVAVWCGEGVSRRGGGSLAELFFLALFPLESEGNRLEQAPDIEKRETMQRRDRGWEDSENFGRFDATGFVCSDYLVAGDEVSPRRRGWCVPL